MAVFAHHTYTVQEGVFKAPVPTRVVFGPGKVATLRSELEALGGKRALILSGKSLAEKTDTVQKVRAALGERCVGVYSGLTQRAPIARALEAAQMGIETAADTLVGVGGSTIADAARMIGFMMTQRVTTEAGIRALGDQHGGLIHPDLTGKSLPLQISVPTTLSAGEYNQGGGKVLDERSAHFIHVRHAALFAQLIVLDPEMTMGTPDWLWLSSGIKAMDHCVERLYTKGNQPAVDASVLMGAELLFRYLPQSDAAKNDLEARLQCQIGSWLSMASVPNNAMGLSHALGHVIGPRYSLNHGYTSCATLPPVMEFNRPASARKQAMLARSLAVDTRGMSDEAAAVAAEKAIADLVARIGMPRRLRELEVPRTDLPLLAELTLKDGGCAYNAVPVTRTDQVMSVLEKAW